MTRTHRGLAIVLALTCLTVGACGGDAGKPEPSPATKRPAAPNAGQCPLTTARPTRVDGPAIPFRDAFEARLESERGRARAPVRLTVEAIQTTRAIRDRFGDRGTFRPATDGVFVAVILRFKNLGDRPAEAANTVGRAFRLQSHSDAFPRADDAAQCSAVSPSYTSDAPGPTTVSPETDVAPGGTYRTALVYVVPRGDQHRLKWVGAGRAAALR